jgi:hypothetical protein
MTEPITEQTSKKGEIIDETAKQQDVIAKSSSSLPDVPDKYFFHSKVHIEEGDIVIVFMVGLLRCLRSGRLTRMLIICQPCSPFIDERVFAGYHCYKRSDVP